MPGGPAFDYTYYNTYTAIVGSVMAWVGVILFESFFSGWSFRNVFFITTILQVPPPPPLVAARALRGSVGPTRGRVVAARRAGVKRRGAARRGQVVAACFDLLIINRWNVSVGIPDKVSPPPAAAAAYFRRAVSAHAPASAAWIADGRVVA